MREREESQPEPQTIDVICHKDEVEEEEEKKREARERKREKKHINFVSRDCSRILSNSVASFPLFCVNLLRIGKIGK